MLLIIVRAELRLGRYLTTLFGPLKKYLPSKLRTLQQRFARYWSDKLLHRTYKALHGTTLDLINPQTFSEKLFHRMIMANRHGNAVLTQLADKYLAREYVREKAGEQYLIKLLWHGSDPNQIPFDQLPSKCMIKTNHACGRNLVFHDGIERHKVIKQFQTWLKNDFYWSAREYHYSDIEPRILIEEYLTDGHSEELVNYRIWCFDGHPEFIQVDPPVVKAHAFYDTNWNKLALSYRDGVPDYDAPEPPNLSEMLSVASKLSAGLGFVRVDLYNLAGKIYFGELTFTPLAGRVKFQPEPWDKTLGKKWIMENG